MSVCFISGKYYLEEMRFKETLKGSFGARWLLPTLWMCHKWRMRWTYNHIGNPELVLNVAESWRLDYIMPNYKEILHVFCGQFCARKAFWKTTLSRWKCQGEMENPSEDACRKALAQIPEGYCPEMQKMASFLLYRILHFWLCYAAITGIMSRVF